MFTKSTQKQHWLFANEKEIHQRRLKANEDFIRQFKDSVKTGIDPKNYFLSFNEEFNLFQHYQFYLRDFCRKFQPPMPKYVTSTAFNYFKRFYLNNSVMDHHPFDIMLTCVYLASKVEEFNISIAQFVANLKRDREKMLDRILNTELLLMQHLNYHLTIHNPYRPIEGFMIDIKTKCPHVKDVEILRPAIDEFVDHSLLTNACLLYPPSQIALAAIIQAAHKLQQDLDSYVQDQLIGSGDDMKYIKLKEILEKIVMIVKKMDVPQSNSIKAIEKKLEKCRNQENNPESQA